MKEIVRSAWDSLPARFPDVMLDEFVMMPNHVHGIVILRGAASGAPTLGKIVRVFKSTSAIRANKVLDRPDQPFWQRNYYEHIIRDEDELNIIRRYIRDSPLKWGEDPDNPANRKVL